MKYNIKQDYLTLYIDNEFENRSIEYLFHHFHVSKKTIHLLKQHKEYTLNNVYVPINTILKRNDKLTIRAFKKDLNPFIPQYHPIEIVYEDEFIFIVNKEPHLNVHPDNKQDLNTLVNYVQYYYIENNYHFPVRYIHRLDYETSGLILFCKCQFFQAYFDEQLYQKNIKRDYLAIISPPIHDNQVHTISTFIAKDRHVSNKMRISNHGKKAITHYQLVKNYSNVSLVKCQLETGRTHQIRVHLLSIGHPIVADKLYGTSSNLIHRHALHAYKLTLIHPLTKEVLSISCPLPQDMQSILDQ